MMTMMSSSNNKPSFSFSLVHVVVVSALLLASSNSRCNAQTTTTPTTPPPPDDAVDTPICNDLLSYTYSTTYQGDAQLADKCSCYYNGFSGSYQLDCDLNHCEECDEATGNCATRKDTYLYDAVILRGNTADIAGAYEGFYWRVFPTQGPLKEDYVEVRLGKLQQVVLGELQPSCEVFLRNAEGKDMFPCDCTYVDCDNDGTLDDQLAYNCTQLEGEAAYHWGQCTTTVDDPQSSPTTVTTATFNTTSPLAVLAGEMFTFESCFSGIPVES